MGMQPPSRVVRHLPGPGAIVAGVGFLLLLASFFALPLAKSGSEDFTLSDIRDVYKAMDDNLAQFDVSNNRDKDFIEIYAEGIYLLVLAVTALGVVVSTLLVPVSKGARMGLGFLAAGLVGLLLNAFDEEGKFGPRVAGTLAIVTGAGIHAVALADMFGDDVGNPDPAIGVWVSLLGFVLMGIGCIIGTRMERSPVTPTPYGPGNMAHYGYR
ncbi:MAG TPA: hypothetical protein VGJ86_17725 [Acidimicrobiales bacterium]|jgi:hypothetical protein